MVVPGSASVKRQAEAEGLDRIFREAGFDWREAGCSMCLGMNPDTLDPGERCASTSNRNFEGRQGRGGRTHLVSPAMAVAAAITGHFTDPRTYGGLMEPFTVHTGIVAPLDRADVDTDQIIPKQFLKRVERTGYGQYLFWDWRALADGTPIAGLRLEPGSVQARRRSWSPETTSAAAPPGSMRHGPCGITVFERSSPRASPTSSVRTLTRTASRHWSYRRTTSSHC